MATTHLITAEELWQSGSDKHVELVRGELREMNPPGVPHGELSLWVGHLILQHVVANRRNVRVTGEGGFIVERNPDTVRAPDVSVFRRERFAADPSQGFYEGAPDLAVEILSPNDRATEVAEKVEMWLRAGCRAVWVIDPRRQTATESRLDDARVTTIDVDVLREESLLPGFELSIKALFEAR